MPSRTARHLIRRLSPLLLLGALGAAPAAGAGPELVLTESGAEAAGLAPGAQVAWLFAGRSQEGYVSRVGSLEGLPMAVERIARTPNTRAAHRLIEMAGQLDCQNAVVNALFKAYFVDGEDVGDIEVLSRIAINAGMNPDVVETTLADTSRDEAIEAREREAQDLGINGVPAFVFNGRMLFSGAQSPETIALSLKRAIARGL